MSEEKHTVRVSNGKYTFVIDGFQTVAILRGGEPWHVQRDAFNALHSIMCELDAARVVLDVARLLGDEAPAPLKLALAQHQALVSDREPPSEWTGAVQ
jgi:hypothetical protein